ncbi:hypothetical protein JRQ81_000007, partial [Phrynocephalus forsythii]
ARWLWVGEGQHRTPDQAQLELPYIQPDTWDPTQQEVSQNFETFHWLVLQGLLKTAPKVINMQKAFGVPQKPGEDSDELLKRLKEGMKQYVGLEPDDPANETALKLQFLQGSVPDVRRKLQKLEVFAEKTPCES